MSITTREAAEVAAANASGRTPVIFVHGLWLLAGSWDAWKARFEDAGYAAIAIDWPGDAESFEAARAGADHLAGVGVGEIADHVEEVIRTLDQKPVLVGHSFGGLLVQILASRGLAAATAAIDPAPFRGVLPLPLSTLKASFPVLGNPANRTKNVLLTFEQFRYGFANAVPEAEARALYDAHHVPGPGRPLFQAAFANFNPGAVTAVDRRTSARGPLVIVEGGSDHIVPPAVAKAAYKLQRKNKDAITEYVEIPGVGHSLVIDSHWGQVADAVLEFFTKVSVS